MSSFIASHLKYPEPALKEKIEGTVVVRAAIDYKGVVIGTEIKSGIGYGCDEEAARVTQLLKFDIESKVRRGKILFHKTININFRLPKQKQVTSRPSALKLHYEIVKKDKGSSAPGYQYTINIG